MIVITTYFDAKHCVVVGLSLSVVLCFTEFTIITSHHSAAITLDVWSRVMTNTCLTCGIYVPRKGGSIEALLEGEQWSRI